jgi:ribosome-associated toxin RatA of RatAB toxin-antitoxin module
MNDTPFTPDMVASAHGPLVQIRLGPDRTPAGAIAALALDYPVERVWDTVSAVDHYAERVPMIQKVKREGNRVSLHLGFKVALFSVGFSFTAEAIASEDHRRFELHWISGEPRGIHLQFDLVPHGDKTIVYLHSAFELFSLGWLVKLFLKHHPEIQYGVFPGTSLALLDSMRRTLAGEPTRR